MFGRGMRRVTRHEMFGRRGGRWATKCLRDEERWDGDIETLRNVNAETLSVDETSRNAEAARGETKQGKHDSRRDGGRYNATEASTQRHDGDGERAARHAKWRRRRKHDTESGGAAGYTHGARRIRTVRRRGLRLRTCSGAESTRGRRTGRSGTTNERRRACGDGGGLQDGERSVQDGAGRVLRVFPASRVEYR